MSKDEGCPTCGSKDFGNISIDMDSKVSVKWKKVCYNCKKSWYSFSQN